MNILVIEDDSEKYDTIRSCLLEIDNSQDFKFTLCSSANEGMIKIGSERFDLIIIDILIPQLEGADPQSIGHTIIPAIVSSTSNYGAHVVAITKYASEAQNGWSKFRDIGGTVLEYNQDKQEWARALKLIAQRIRPKTTYEFAIFCALSAEAVAFRNTPMEIGASEIRFGISSYSAKLGDWSGRIFVAPQVGPVDAAGIVARIFENIDPDIFCVAGICGGHPKRSTLGQLIVADPCWDHQSGKLSPDGLLNEAYQIRMPAITREMIGELVQDQIQHQTLLQEIPPPEPIPVAQPAIAPFCSGASVIADDISSGKFEESHRKISGVDMEMYAAYRVAFMKGRTQFFGAKAVVDHIGTDKDDTWHSFSSTYSARFCTEAIRRMLS